MKKQNQLLLKEIVVRPRFQNLLNQFFRKNSEGGTFRAFQIEVRFDYDLNPGEEEVLFENFNVNYKFRVNCLYPHTFTHKKFQVNIVALLQILSVF